MNASFLEALEMHLNLPLNELFTGVFHGSSTRTNHVATRS